MRCSIGKTTRVVGPLLTLLALLSVAATAADTAGAPRPEAVSPGKLDRTVEMGDGCSTFSWSAVDGARGFELAVHRVDGGAAELETGTAPALSLRLPATLSWTPSLEECLPPGRYAWIVRADTAAGWTEWSEPRLFAVRGDTRDAPPPTRPQPAHAAPTVVHSGLSPSSAGIPDPEGERAFTSAAAGPRSVAGAAYSPSCSGFIFSDVTFAHPYCGWIEQLAQDEIASACEQGLFWDRYCPDQPVTRGQIAMLLERAMRGTNAWRPEQGDGTQPNLPPALAGFNPLDIGGDVGTHTSITVGADGLGLISYYDAVGKDLRVAHCANVNCTFLDATTMLDTDGDVGKFTSIAIGADGRGLLSYYDETNGDLKVAHCADVNCTFADAITPVDTTDNMGQFSSITIGPDGLGLISYWDGFHGWLKSAHCSNPDCTAATFAALDSPVVGQHTSITIGSDGRGLISYYDALQNDLKAYHCSNSNCGTTGSPTVTPLADGGAYTSIAFGADGLGLISYYDGDLRVAHCSNVNCTAATISPLDTVGDVGLYTSITIGTDGLGLISYYDNTNHDLKVAHCSNPVCTAATITALDTAGDVGQYTAITIGDDGLGLISYYDATSGDLKVAHCSNVLCAPYFRRR
jgi:hypothetical protein